MKFETIPHECSFSAINTYSVNLHCLLVGAETGLRISIVIQPDLYHWTWSTAATCSLCRAANLPCPFQMKQRRFYSVIPRLNVNKTAFTELTLYGLLWFRKLLLITYFCPYLPGGRSMKLLGVIPWLNLYELSG